MLQVNLTNETNFKELLNLLLSGENYKLVLMKGNEAVAKIVPEKEMTDAEKIQEWARLNKIKKDDEIVTIKDGNPVLVKKAELEATPLVIPPETAKRIGIAKGKMNLPPDFDEWFDAMDAEILEDFSDDPDCEF